MKGWETIITAIAAVIVAATPGFLAWLQSRKTHLLVNSRLTELLELTRKAAKAEGKLEAVDEQSKANLGNPKLESGSIDQG